MKYEGSFFAFLSKKVIKAVIVLKEKYSSYIEDSAYSKIGSNKLINKQQDKIVSRAKQSADKLKEELSLFVKKNYAGHAYPKIVSFVKELPKGNSGKIIRARLKWVF